MRFTGCFLPVLLKKKKKWRRALAVAEGGKCEFEADCFWKFYLSLKFDSNYQGFLLKSVGFSFICFFNSCESIDIKFPSSKLQLGILPISEYYRSVPYLLRANIIQ